MWPPWHASCTNARIVNTRNQVSRAIGILIESVRSTSLPPSVVTVQNRFALAMMLGALLLVGGAAFAVAQARAGLGADVPVNVTARPGDTTATVAVVSWEPGTADSDGTEYRVWRAAMPDGRAYLIGSTDQQLYEDTFSSEGQSYYYRVSAVTGQGQSALSDPAGPIVARDTLSPHGTANEGSRTCAQCHSTHVAAVDGTLARPASVPSGDSGVCFSCHSGVGSKYDVFDGADDSFALTSGHSIEETGDAANTTASCASCHSPHLDPAKNPRNPQPVIQGRTTAGGNTAWCLSCHAKPSGWTSATPYPDVAAPKTNSAGYPVLGTFPGEAAYLADSNPHGSLPASSAAGRTKGDCLNCHAAHRGPSAYDGLVAQYRPTTQSTLATDQTQGTYAAACFSCHGGAPSSAAASGAADIKQFATADNSTAGHRIRTQGGNLPVGSPLPCYDCHNPHGSTRGNASLIADTRGASLETSSASGSRRFCFSCHTSSDGAFGWDGGAAAYSAVSASDTVEGIPRTGGVLALPDTEQHRVTGTAACSSCHGHSYEAGGANVHNPTTGAPSGGQACLSCHQGGTGSTVTTASADASGAIAPTMFSAAVDTSATVASADTTASNVTIPYAIGVEPSATAAPESSATTTDTATATVSFRHLSGTTIRSGDATFGPGSVPDPTDGAQCLACHRDHDRFLEDGGNNLKPVWP